MWRAREKELELDAKLKSRGKSTDAHHRDNYLGESCEKVSRSRHEEEDQRRSTSSKRGHEDHTYYSSDEAGLRDDEVEEFLRSRVKRGRGAIGSRMDEPGPYPSTTSSDHDNGRLLGDTDTREKEEWEHHVLGPEKPSFIKYRESSPEEARQTNSAKKEHHSKKKRKKRSEEEKRERKKSKEKKKSKHRQHKSRRSDLE